jgi:hypothetical protein
MAVRPAKRPGVNGCWGSSLVLDMVVSSRRGGGG